MVIISGLNRSMLLLFSNSSQIPYYVHSRLTPAPAFDQRRREHWRSWSPADVVQRICRVRSYRLCGLIRVVA